jgi:hypothetical protein
MIESYKNLIICGDLNAKSIKLGCKTNNKSGELLSTILEESNLILLNQHLGDTFFIANRDYGELLDLVMTTPSIASKLIEIKTLEDSQLCSDHLPIWCEFEVAIQIKPKESVEINKLNYSKADWEKYKTLLCQQTNTLDINNTGELDKLNEFINNSIKTSAYASIPKVRSRKITSLPPEIIKCIKDKRKLCRVYAKSHDENIKKELTAMKNKIKRMIKEVRNKQWSEFIQSVGPNPISTKPFWKRINRFRNAPISNSIPTIKEGGIEYKTDKEKAEVFAKHLASTFSEDPTQNFNEAFKNEVDNTLQRLYPKQEHK